MLRRIANQRVQKKCRARSGELQYPGLAPVGGFVNSGFLAFAAGHHVRCLVVERLNAAEIQRLAADYVQPGPNFARARRLQNHTVGTGGPDDGSGSSPRIRKMRDADPAQIGLDARRLHHPNGRGRRSGNQQKNCSKENSHGAHSIKVPGYSSDPTTLWRGKPETFAAAPAYRYS